MTDTIYVVQGSTGEYSDRINWLVKAFRTEERARQFIRLLEYTRKQYTVEYFSRYNSGQSKWESMEKAMTAIDPFYQEDYTGTYYFCEEVKLED